MYYPDLGSLVEVGDLPMPEFNLRVICISERLKWEQGPILDDSTGVATKPNVVKGMKLQDILLDIKRRQERAKQGGTQ